MTQVRETPAIPYGVLGGSLLYYTWAVLGWQASSLLYRGGSMSWAADLLWLVVGAAVIYRLPLFSAARDLYPIRYFTRVSVWHMVLLLQLLFASYAYETHFDEFTTYLDIELHRWQLAPLAIYALENNLFLIQPLLAAFMLFLPMAVLHGPVVHHHGQFAFFIVVLNFTLIYYAHLFLPNFMAAGAISPFFVTYHLVLFGICFLYACLAYVVVAQKSLWTPILVHLFAALGADLLYAMNNIHWLDFLECAASRILSTSCEALS